MYQTSSTYLKRKSEILRKIRQIDLTSVIDQSFKQRSVGCIVITHDNKILLQHRGESWDHFPAFLSEFGGKIEFGEKPIHALVRELKEELGAEVKTADVVRLGAITEEVTKHSHLIYLYFWHDLHSTITGCYEGDAHYFENIEEVFLQSKVMESVLWSLCECQKRQLIV